MNTPHEDDEFNRMVAEEDLILAATEAVAEAMNRYDVSRTELATRLHVTPGEVTQRMSGSRNMTLRSLAAMLHTLGARAELRVRYADHADEVAATRKLSFRYAIPVAQTGSAPGGFRQPLIQMSGSWQKIDSPPLIAKAS